MPGQAQVYECWPADHEAIKPPSKQWQACCAGGSQTELTFGTHTLVKVVHVPCARLKIMIDVYRMLNAINHPGIISCTSFKVLILDLPGQCTICALCSIWPLAMSICVVITLPFVKCSAQSLLHLSAAMGVFMFVIAFAFEDEKAMKEDAQKLHQYRMQVRQHILLF